MTYFIEKQLKCTFLNALNILITWLIENLNLMTDFIEKQLKMHFSFQGIELRHNTSEGIILTNQSLVLQRISRRRSGSYTCQAANEVGRGSSQNIFLNVKCKICFSPFITSLHSYRISNPFDIQNQIFAQSIGKT